MHANVRAAHELLWTRFHRPDSDFFYEHDCADAARFPTAAEIAGCVPNSAGWATGMEDCCLNGGWILDGLLCAHEATGGSEWAQKARSVFRGLTRLGALRECPGFVARGFAPGRCEFYPNSSVDQYTSFVYAMWRFSGSALAAAADRQTAARLAGDVCRLLERFNHDVPTRDMQPSIYGDASAISPDRACRLLLFYKVAHALEGDPHWDALYRQKRDERDGARLRCTCGPDPIAADRNLHGAVQSQAAWYALSALEAEPAARQAYQSALRDNARSVLYRIDGWRDWEPGAHDPDPNWRELWQTWRKRNPDVDVRPMQGCRQFLHYRHAHSPTFVNDRKHMRNPLDAFAVCMWSGDEALCREAADKARPLLERTDFSRVQFGTALACLEGAYWRGRSGGFLA